MSVYILRRETKTKGVRWHVRYEEGRNDPVVHLGVFAKESDAIQRRNAALAEIANGRVPRRPRISDAEPRAATVAEAGEAWLASLLDLADSTRHYYARSVASLPDWLAGMRPSDVTHAHAQALVDDMQKRRGFSRATIKREMVPLRQLLDYVGVPANAALDRRVRYPRGKRKVYRLPTRVELAELHRLLPNRRELMLLLEHTGLRTHEAAALRCRDIDERRERLLVADSKTPSGVRFVERLAGAPPLPRVSGREPSERVFSPSPHSLNAAIRNSGGPLFSAHDWRHLHASRLLHDGILSPAQIAARLGHSNPGITLGTYSHVVPPD